MSELQWGLAAIGAIIVVGVLVYNKWQESRARERADRAFAGGHRDVLLRGEGGTPDRRPAGPAGSPDRAPAAPSREIEHTIDAVEPQAAGAGVPPPPHAEAAPPHSAVLDPAIDCIVPIECARPVSGGAVARQARDLLDESLTSAVHWEGEERAGAGWTGIVAGREYERLRVGLQLASRAGPVGAEDILAFCGATQEVALALGAAAELPDPDAVVAQAEALDRFCAEVDVQVGLSVIGSESHTFAGSQIRALAESAGMHIGRDGRFHRAAEDGSELFTLANMEPMPFHAETMKTLHTRGVTALFDVPRVAAGTGAFRRFVDFAHQLEHSLGGVLVDDNRKPIGEEALEAIAQQLDRIHAGMSAHGIPPGGPAARRLFS